jgi:GT2 family glycosyltransferase
MKNKKITLSIVIVSFNTKDFTLGTISSLVDSYPKELENGDFEVIIVDNDSSDGSQKAIENFDKKSLISKFTFVKNDDNYGFSKANNIGVRHATGEYILFLNSDTQVPKNTLTTLISFMRAHEDAGALTCEVLLKNGKIDDASHRGFPTPWNAFCHFSGLSKIFSKTKLFGGYNKFYLDLKSVHLIDAVAGAFLMVRYSAGEQIKWWDEDYFFYGEDIDFCYQLKQHDWKIYYIPNVWILHYKGVSGGFRKESRDITKASLATKLHVQTQRFLAMRIFYKKHYMHLYPKWITWLVFKSIDILEKRNIARFQMK